MGKPTGFKEFDRRAVAYRDPLERAGDYLEIFGQPDVGQLQTQGARCMDCGVPFCQSDTGCPIDNLIPEWNDLVYQDRWRDALDRLHKTNNFPEFTGRACPAPCEGACVLGITSPPVTIKNIENAIIDRGWEEGWVVPQPPEVETGKKVAIVGSGPAGLAAAQQLRRAGPRGHRLRAGRPHRRALHVRHPQHEARQGDRRAPRRPDARRGRQVRHRRARRQGEEFEPGHMTAIMQEREVPLKFVDPNHLVDEFDAVLLATGATTAVRPDGNAPGRDLEGIHFAMDFLTRNTKSLLDSKLGDKAYLSAEGLDVVVIGGGDTGADCIGTSLRHGAKSIVNLEVVPQPPDERRDSNPWPQWPQVYRVDYSHAEMKAKTGEDPRQYQTLTKEYVGEDGKLTGVKTVTIDWSKPIEGGAPFTEVARQREGLAGRPGAALDRLCRPELSLVEMLGLETQAPRGNWKTIKAEHGRFTTSVEGVFAAGDCRRGQSLVVWAINEGRGAARAIDDYLMGYTELAAPGLNLPQQVV